MVSLIHYNTLNNRWYVAVMGLDQMKNLKLRARVPRLYIWQLVVPHSDKNDFAISQKIPCRRLGGANGIMLITEGEYLVRDAQGLADAHKARPRVVLPQCNVHYV